MARVMYCSSYVAKTDEEYHFRAKGSPQNWTPCENGGGAIFENYEICIFDQNKKLSLGTIENGLAASGLPPEGPKKGSYVEKSTCTKIKKSASGPSKMDSQSPVSAQRVRKKGVMSKRALP